MLVMTDDIDIIKVHCNKLKARNEHLYSSFHLQIRVSAADMGRALDLVMCNESWPVATREKVFQA